MWNFHGFLVLTGVSGVGKSFGAVCTVKEYLMSRIPDSLDARTRNCAERAGERVIWCSANRIIHDRKTAVSACEKRFLVLDDLGREGDAQIRRADIADVISARYDAKLPTIITTELTLSDIIEA
jgi:DNA replication protein DnaC